MVNYNVAWKIVNVMVMCYFFFSSGRRHTRYIGDWSQTCALPIWTRLGARQPGEHVGPVELQAVQAVGLLRRRRVRFHALDLLAQQAGAPQQIRDERHLERQDVDRKSVV